MNRRDQTRGQRFVKADYYELDWYYEECTDVLCADRVGQMTKTYSDIDAVTRLLEEKERDLELAARIGQSLLKKSKTLSERNELLEEQVEHIREEVSQLRHDLSMKDDLLQFYTSAAEESEGESATSTPIHPSDAGVSIPTYFPLDSLQRKLKDLEEENLSLRSEASHLETETICYEEKEQQLVNDCVKELRDANLQMSSLAEELARKTEDASRQQEEITHLLSQIVDLQKKAKSYAVENEELTLHLGAAKDAQRQLTAELRELEDKYAECMEMLHEAQEELKNLRNKSVPQGTNRRFHSLGLFPMDSLAAEIEGTMRKELQMDDPEVEEQKLHPKRVFQTVRNLNLMRQQRSSLSPSPLNIPGSNQTSCLTSGRSSRVGTPHCNSMYGSETGSSCILDNKTASPDDGSGDSNRRPPGTPGTPGGRDLEAALRRLSLRRDNYLSERRFFEEERERKLAYLAKEEEEAGGGDSVDGPGTPAESLLSLCTHPSLGSVWSGYSFSVRSYLPEKLQIVKPLEGSATLHAWQQLAQPHLGRLLDHRPGVVTKGFRSLEHEHEQEGAAWHLDQPEEDDESPAPFTGTPSSLPCSSTPNPSPSVRHRAVDPVADPQVDPLPCLWRGPTLMNGSLRGKDGVVPSPSPPPLPPAQADATELQARQAGVVDSVPVNFPGKCMSHTSATYTFTTCRILHPSDQLTSVSSSPAMSSCQSSRTFFGSSPIPASSPAQATPPYTPRSLSLSRAESSTNVRDPTRTTSTSLGLVRLLLEQGISSSVYDPRSWDRATPPSPGRGDDGRAAAVDAETGAAAHHRHFLPATPPNSPTGRAPPKTPPSPTFLLSPSCDEPPFYETFLASRPARSILREILGESERGGAQGDQGQAEVSNLRLLDKLKRFRARPPPPLPAPAALLGLGGGSSALGGGLRRNRSYPAMVGASMAMKDPGGPPSARILSPLQHTAPRAPPCHSGGACQSARSRPPRQTRPTDDACGT